MFVVSPTWYHRMREQHTVQHSAGIITRRYLQNLLELVQKFEAVLDGGDVVEGGVNESLQGPLQLADLHIELNVIPVELIVVVA